MKAPSLRRAPCPLCGADSAKRLRVFEHDIHRCDPCDFEFVHPLPDVAVLTRVYESNYFSGAGHGYRDYLVSERPGNLRKAAARLARLQALGVERGARVLDIGCADGTFVSAALAQGLDAHGVEVSKEALAAVPPELRDRVHPSLEAASGLGAWDVVTMWDVLEHLPEFLLTLRRARAALAANGLFAIVVPVIDNANARFWPATWDQYKPPEHLWYFSRKSLRATLTREIGEVVAEDPAWRREARILDVLYSGRSPLVHPFRLAERSLWRQAERLGWLSSMRFEDSVGMYARAR